MLNECEVVGRELVVARCDSTTLLDPVEEAFNDIAGPVELWAETGPSPASLRVHGLAELAGADHTPYVGDSDALLDGIEEFLTEIRPVPSRIELWQQFFSPMSSILRSRQHRKWGELLQRHHVLCEGVGAVPWPGGERGGGSFPDRF
jgi:hypothetical protein